MNNPVVQKNLDAMINKRTKELFVEADYMVKAGEEIALFRYSVTLSKNNLGKYVISHECLSTKKAISKSEFDETVFEVSDGEIVTVYEGKEKDKFVESILNKTMNLLTTASMSALFYEKFIKSNNMQKKKNILWAYITFLYVLGEKIHVYLDDSDNHRKNFLEIYDNCINVINITGNIVPQEMYKHFEKTVNKLFEFLHIFKTDLKGIEIDRKEDHELWVCDLVMCYESYKIHAEFESTGIKKLIKLFAYLKEMVQGGIVFIDEFDSNLHDVYLCALLEYLMEYGEGQLCFTTHNVGPMDVLKQHKKSIDFLSENHRIYPWTTNGNYSPSKLYRNGMIEGSPFNVDSIDFIGVFGTGEVDE